MATQRTRLHCSLSSADLTTSLISQMSFSSLRYLYIALLLLPGVNPRMISCSKQFSLLTV